MHSITPNADAKLGLDAVRRQDPAARKATGRNFVQTAKRDWFACVIRLPRPSPTAKSPHPRRLRSELATRNRYRGRSEMPPTSILRMPESDMCENTSNESKNWHLPPGVDAKIIGADGQVTYILRPFTTEDKWPGVAVDTSEFRSLSAADKLYQQATAFIDAAAVLCQAAGEKGQDLRWSDGSVCYYCINIATELYLKAAILRAGSKSPPTVHDISGLLRLYEELLPDGQFHFPTPWRLSATDIEEALGQSFYAEVDRKPDQLYRYAIGKDGRGSAGLQFFTPSYMFGYIAHLRRVWESAWNSIPGNR